MGVGMAGWEISTAGASDGAFTSRIGHVDVAHMISILAQVSTEQPSASVSWWQVLMDNALGLTLVLIFVAAIIVALVNAWRRDKCLKLMHDYHVTYLTTAGPPAWGDLVVYSRGIELRFGAPYTTRHGTTKSSSLIYDDEMGHCLALCRISTALTKNESRNRARQITRTFNPGLIRRTMRLLRNIANTFRDAIAKSISAILGQLSKAKPGLAGGKGEVEQLGKTLLGTVENAYEPMLEKHIGRPVILRLTHPANKDLPPIELPGYLVDYTDKYVAVFNVEHMVEESLDLEVSGPVEQRGLKIELGEDELTIHSLGPDVLAIRRAQIGERQYDLDVILLPGCFLSLTRNLSESLALNVERTRRIDIVCPRSVARVYFGSDQPTKVDSDAARHGLAPREAEDAHA